MSDAFDDFDGDVPQTPALLLGSYYDRLLAARDSGVRPSEALRVAARQAPACSSARSRPVRSQL